MPESAQQYTQRILSNVDKDPVAILSASAQALGHLIQNVPDADLRQRPTPQQWSIAEIVAHLADAEVVASFRIRKILSESGSTISAYDEKKWEENLNYNKRDPQQEAKNFATLRNMNLALLRNIRDDQWDRYGMHEERGKETLRQLIRLYAGHDVNHLKQIEAIRTQTSNRPAA